MKIAIISDIHANLTAVERVLEDKKRPPEASQWAAITAMQSRR